MRWLILAFVVFLVPQQSHAAVCASQDQTTVSGNYISEGYGDPYAVAFTVTQNCDVTGIQLYAGNDGTTDTWTGRIWDTNGNTLVTGGVSALITVTWNTCMYATSTIAQGTYTLTSGNTYYVGMVPDGTGHIRQCMGSTGLNRVKYYPAGGPWTDWVLQYPAFSITGVQSGGGGGGSVSSATSSADLLNAWNYIYFGLTIAFGLSMWSTIWIWRRLV